MITELALAVASANVTPIHHFRIAVQPGTPNYLEATINVDPSAGIQAGWLGFQDSPRMGDLVQIGWLTYSAGGCRPFYQVWNNGVITDTAFFGPQLAAGSNITVAMTTNARGQWLVWYKEAPGKWTVAWMGQDVLTPNTGEWVVATESQGTAAVPVLRYRIGG